jgi:hypothetical protein
LSTCKSIDQHRFFACPAQSDAGNLDSPGPASRPRSEGSSPIQWWSLFDFHVYQNLSSLHGKNLVILIWGIPILEPAQEVEMKIPNCSVRVGELCLTTALLLPAVGAIQLFVLHAQAKTNAHAPQVFAHPVFRYAIIYNDPWYDKSHREITILMDPSEFSEANLRTLFMLLSQRYKSLTGFNAYIETSLQDIDTPEMHEGPGYSECKDCGNPKGGKSPAATIRHSPECDTLYIYLPSRATEHPNKIDLRTPLIN